jgi:hypothetical protein
MAAFIAREISGVIQRSIEIAALKIFDQVPKAKKTQFRIPSHSSPENL